MSPRRHVPWTALLALVTLVAWPVAGGLCADDKTLDLPVERPVKATPAPTPQPTPIEPVEPPTIYGTEIKSENQTIVIVLDASGSMWGSLKSYTDVNGQVRRGNRMDRAKDEAVKCIRGLPQSFRFNVLAYDCSVEAWSAGLQPATETNKAMASQWTLAISPGGGTGTGPAVVQSLMDRSVKLVALVTDGRPNCGVAYPYGDTSCLEQHRVMISTANIQKAKIDVFGIEADGMCERFCLNIAADSGGGYVSVP